MEAEILKLLDNSTLEEPQLIDILFDTYKFSTDQITHLLKARSDDFELPFLVKDILEHNRKLRIYNLFDTQNKGVISLQDLINKRDQVPTLKTVPTERLELMFKVSSNTKEITRNEFFELLSFIKM